MLYYISDVFKTNILFYACTFIFPLQISLAFLTLIFFAAQLKKYSVKNLLEMKLNKYNATCREFFKIHLNLLEVYDVMINMLPKL